MRSCYNINLVGNDVNKTTAKATLTQVLSVVFQRMETAEQQQLQFKAQDDIVSNLESRSSASSSSAGAAAATTGAVPPSGGSGASSGSAPPSPFPTIQHKNAYLLFRALCKLSMKSMEATPGQAVE